MKTAMTLSAWALLVLAACGVSAATEQEPLSAPTAAAGAVAPECTPVDACEPGGPLFCAAGDACHLLYPNQDEVPVSCLARPATPAPGRTARRCP